MWTRTSEFGLGVVFRFSVVPDSESEREGLRIRLELCAFASLQSIDLVNRDILLIRTDASGLSRMYLFPREHRQRYCVSPGARTGKPLAGMFVNLDSGILKSRRWDSNPRPDDYKSPALPAELRRHVWMIVIARA